MVLLSGYETNNIGLAATFQPFVAAMAARRSGTLVGIASVAGVRGIPGHGAYSSSKAAVISYCESLRGEMRPSNVRVVTIAPGIMQTPMMAGMPPEVQASLEEAIPHPSRMGTPAEYAALVRHIVENPLLNGETIRLDGAIRMQPK